MSKPRLLVFDILRIVAILLVVLSHLRGLNFLNIEYFLYNSVQYFNAGTIGVALFLFISGAVLEYTHRHISTIRDLSRYYYHRFSRIYPIYWISIIITLFIAPVYIEPSLAGLISQFSGFMTSPFHFQWFIGLIVFMYLIFPLLSKSMEKFPWLTLGTIFAVSIFSIFLVSTSGLEIFGIGPQSRRTFPLCNLMEFGLGIFIVQQNLYPKSVNNSRIIRMLSDMTFYIFLIHQPIRYALYGNPENIWGVNAWVFPHLLEFLILIFTVSYGLMVLDQKIQGYFNALGTKLLI